MKAASASNQDDLQPVGLERCSGGGPMATGTNAWIEDELAGCHFADERLSTLLDQMAGAMGDSIPL